MSQSFAHHGNISLTRQDLPCHHHGKRISVELLQDLSSPLSPPDGGQLFDTAQGLGHFRVDFPRNDTAGQGFTNLQAPGESGIKELESKNVVGCCEVPNLLDRKRLTGQKHQAGGLRRGFTPRGRSGDDENRQSPAEQVAELKRH